MNLKFNSQKTAHFLSIILGPHTWLPVFLGLFLFKSGLNADQLKILFPIMLIFQVATPLLYLFIAPKVGLATSWDLPVKRERRLFMVITFLSTLVSLWFVFKFGNRLVIDLNIILFVLLMSIFGVTTVWKISYHAAVNTFGTLLVNFLYGWQFSWLYLLIPLVYWGRLTLKRHTHAQLLAGILVSGAIFLGGLRLFGYL